MTQEFKPSQHPELELMESLWRSGMRAKEIVQYLSDADLPPVKLTALAKYGQRKWNGVARVSLEADSPSSVDDLQEIVTEFKEAGLKVSKITQSTRSGWRWEKINGVNTQVPAETTAQSIELSIPEEIELERATLPEINVTVSKSNNNKDPRIGLAISLPDQQIGYHRDAAGNLTSLQDERVLDVTHQIMADLQAEEGIDLAVFQGDGADFAEFGKYTTPVSLMGNTQLTINRIGAEAAVVRKLVPDGDVVYIPGNHEARMEKILIEKVPSIVGLSRANTNESVLGLDYLCRFDEYNIQYIDGYPNNEYWANDGLKFIHGSTVKAAKGATGAAMLSQGVSVVYGHIHRQELVWGLKTSRDASYNIWAGSAGTACKITGEVPSFRSGVAKSGQPATKPGTEDWQQGLMVIYYEKNGFNSWPEMVTITDGVTYFRGKRYESTVDADGNPLTK